MRITPNMIFNQLTSSLDKTLETYSKLNTILASGKKINAPSDDPYGILQDLDYKVSISANDQFTQNITSATTRLNLAGTVLSSASTMIANIKALVSKNSTTQDATTQATDAALAATYRDQLYDVGNTQDANNQYLFSGFLSNTQPYAAGTYAYQGDGGLVNVPVSQNRTIANNIPGSSAFSYTLAAATSLQLGSGEYVHYTPGAGTTVNVEIRASDDTTVLDNFSFSNVLQMTDTLSSAISGNNTLRVQALASPFDAIDSQIQLATTDVSMRTASLKDQADLLTQNNNTLQDAVSSLETADQASIIAQLQTTNVTLQALESSAAKILPESLFNFLK